MTASTQAAELTSETVVPLIRPTLDAFVANIEPTLHKVSEELYERLLYSVQDYLRENAEWNIGQEIDRCRQIERDNIQLRLRNEELTKALRGLNISDILGCAESCASGQPRWPVVNDRITYARHVLAQGEPA